MDGVHLSLGGSQHGPSGAHGTDSESLGQLEGSVAFLCLFHPGWILLLTCNCCFLVLSKKSSEMRLLFEDSFPAAGTLGEDQRLHRAGHSAEGLWALLCFLAPYGYRVSIYSSHTCRCWARSQTAEGSTAPPPRELTV